MAYAKIGTVPTPPEPNEFPTGGGTIFTPRTYTINPSTGQPVVYTPPVNQQLNTVLNNFRRTAIQQTTPTCNCITGTPYINSDGSCGCINETNNTTLPTYTTRQPTVANPQVKFSPFPLVETPVEQTNIVQLIKDNPLIAGGVALGLAYLLFKK